MPPYILPASLFKISLLKVQVLIHNSCCKIENLYGTYESHDCIKAVNLLQRYLLYNIPGMVLDEIFIQQEYMKSKSSLEYQTKEQLQDLRIRLAVYMHPNMRTFKVVMKSADMNDNFWMRHLCNMNNLVVLNLNYACTDEILEVVGRTCFKLEEINIVSKLEPCLTRTTFNALKLKYFVSDEGLQHLTNCKKLKKIIMNNILKSRYAGRMMTHTGIRNLVRMLPFIQSITYDDMGVVLSDGMDDVHSLPLMYISDHYPSPTHIMAVSRLCTNLQHLCLCFQMRGMNNNLNVDIASEVLEALARSELRPVKLHLKDFPIRTVLSLLRSKGQYLENLKLEIPGAFVKVSVVRTIGQTCPNLRNLDIREFGFLQMEEEFDCVEQQNWTRSEPLFCNLVELLIYGVYWKPEIILPVCISHAKHLQSLTVANNSVCFLDKTFAQILINNPLKEMESLILYCFISMRTINYFYTSCPQLVELRFLYHPGVMAEDIKPLQDEIKSSNLNLRLLGVDYGKFSFRD